jgi:WD40 repeat protein
MSHEPPADPNANSAEPPAREPPVAAPPWSVSPTVQHVPESSREASTGAQTGARSDAATYVGTPGEHVSAAAVLHIPRYELLGELGRGGNAVVYRARQQALNRPVALKILLSGAHAGLDELRRFRTEAEAIARLQHPNIVQVHEVGEYGGTPYLSLELCRGGSLEDALAGMPLPPVEAARVAETLAAAVHVAHLKGIVHRDLKPGNVLLAELWPPPGSRNRFPVPTQTLKITDFGLAKVHDVSGQTQTGSILGTPSYMAPEQARGDTRRSGPPADIYSLGAILYELLTGRPPFNGASAMDTVLQVVHDEPIPPRQLQPSIPRDLDTICRRCLQQEPRKRYASAAALADDLRCFLDGRPIAARPAGVVERTIKWARRHPAWASLLAVSVAAVTALVSSALVHAARIENALEKTRRALAAEHAANLVAETTLIDLCTTLGLSAGEHGDPSQAVLWFAEAVRVARHDQQRVQDNRTRFSSWLKRCLPLPTPLPHGGPFLRVLAVHPAGRLVLTADADHKCAIREAGTGESQPLPGGQRAVRAACWSPEGTVLALGEPEGEVRVYRFPHGEEVGGFRVTGSVDQLAFNGDGRFLAVVSGTTARVWDSRARSFATGVLDHPGAIEAFRFSAAGDRLATAAADCRARVFAIPANPARPGPLFRPVPHRARPSGRTDLHHGFPLAPVFVDRDRALLTVADGGKVVRVDAATGREERAVECDPRTVFTLCPSRDGRQFVVGGTAGARLWDAESLRPAGPILAHANSVIDVALDPSGKVLLTACLDTRVRLWSLAEGESLPVELPHQANVYRAAFLGDGDHIITAQEGGPVFTWTLPPPPPRGPRVPLEKGKSSLVGLSPDGKYLIPRSVSSWFNPLTRTRVHEAATGVAAGPVLDPGGTILNAALAPDGHRAAILVAVAQGEGGRVEFWDWRAGRREGSAIPTPSEPHGLAFDPAGTRLAVVCNGGEVLLIDLNNRKRLRSLTSRWHFQNDFRAEHICNGCVCWHRDGRALAAWGLDHRVQVWAVDQGDAPIAVLDHPGKCLDVSFSPAEPARLVIGGIDGTARTWDWSRAEPVSPPLPHPDWVYSVRWSPDGSRILTGCRDNMARLWDWKEGALVLSPFEHRDEVFCAEFTPDGRHVLTASRDRTVGAWELHFGKLAVPFWPLPGFGFSIAVTPDGRHAVVGGAADEIPLLDLSGLEPAASAAADPEDLCLLAQLVSARRVYHGGTVYLTAKEWVDRWRQLRTRPVTP